MKWRDACYLKKLKKTHSNVLGEGRVEKKKRRGKVVKSHRERQASSKPAISRVEYNWTARAAREYRLLGPGLCRCTLRVRDELLYGVEKKIFQIRSKINEVFFFFYLSFIFVWVLLPVETMMWTIEMVRLKPNRSIRGAARSFYGEATPSKN